MKPYLPIKQESDADEADQAFLCPETGPSLDEDPESPSPPTLQRSRRWTLAEAVLLFLLLSSNAGWLMHQFVWKPSLKELDYFGRPEKITVAFDHDWVGLEDNAPKGHRYADEKWRDMIPMGGGSVSVTNAFAAKHGLPKGAESTEHPGEMHYIIAGYHQLHCLSEIRDQLYEPVAIDSMADGDRRDHVLHCVEAVRQALYCFLDPTLVNLEPEWPHVPNGQHHVCRNRAALGRWAEEHASPLPGM